MKRKLGTGSSGTVWLAINTENHQKKAIKCVKKTSITDMTQVDVEIKV